MPIEDVVGVMKDFVDAGKVKYLGVSNIDADSIRRAHAVYPTSVLQHEYSIFAHDVEPLLPVLEELGIGFVTYSPLARGFLSGAAKSRDRYAADDFRQNIARWNPENFAVNVAIVDELIKIAESKGTSLSQPALGVTVGEEGLHRAYTRLQESWPRAQNIAAASPERCSNSLAALSRRNRNRSLSPVPVRRIGGV